MRDNHDWDTCWDIFLIQRNNYLIWVYELYFYLCALQRIFYYWHPLLLMLMAHMKNLHKTYAEIILYSKRWFSQLQKCYYKKYFYWCDLFLPKHQIIYLSASLSWPDFTLLFTVMRFNCYSDKLFVKISVNLPFQI